ncbi:hypothetical protein KDL29_02875 [bacterium]|nr:hypothetical protein [bacterium]
MGMLLVAMLFAGAFVFMLFRYIQKNKDFEQIREKYAPIIKVEEAAERSHNMSI